MFTLVERLKQLFRLEAEYGPPLGHTPALDQLIDYYNKVNYMLCVGLAIVIDIV